jgi:EpsD family peptidyl-prolyl cis-trans isomerase
MGVYTVHAKLRLAGGAMIATLLLAGCHKEPKGQVVAIVNGDEISMQELNAELQGVRIPDNVDRKVLRKEILERLIDRKLIVQKAKDQGVDKTPDYVAQKRRLDDNLLVSMLGQKIAQTVPVPDDRDINQYINDNPSLFAQRQRLLLDQLQFDAPKDVKRLLALRDAHSLDAVAAGLQQLGISFTRGKGVIDTGRLDPQLMKKINELPAGEPFILPSSGKFVASVIISRDTIGTPSDVARAVATEAVRRRALVKESQAQVVRARKEAEIQYQSGFEPTKGTPAPAATPAKPAQ